MSERPEKAQRSGSMSTNPEEKPPESSKEEESSAKRADSLDEGLVSYYNDLLNEPLPDRFKDLLKQLEAKDKK